VPIPFPPGWDRVAAVGLRRVGEEDVGVVGYVAKMTTLKLAALCIVLGSLIGCDVQDRTNKLEKQVQELQAKTSKQDAIAEYDLQAKCSKDARAWFNENWSRDKDTILLDFTNHYKQESQ